jgi:hypothetical protein
VAIGLNAVILAVTDDRPRVLTVSRTEHALTDRSATRQDALPFGPLDPGGDRTLELELREWVREQTGLELAYVEQLYTFGDRHRDPRERAGGPRVLSVAYLALVKEGRVAGMGEARWRDAYDFLPWENWRAGRPGLIDEAIAPVLKRWAREPHGRSEQHARRERGDVVFGLHGAAFNAERVIERYELLYEAGLVLESWQDREQAPPASVIPIGHAMSLDHRRLLATALGRVRGKLKYRPVVFDLIAETFTLSQLQRVVEALAGVPLHKQNFRRLVEKARLVEPTGEQEDTGGRPAALFRFRREVLRERRTAGVGLPGIRVL